MRIRPFQAIRPAANQAAKVSCPPYDVITTAHARDLAVGDEDSFLNVIRPEINLPEGTPFNDDSVYNEAASQFQKLVANGTLQRDEMASIAIYRLSWQGRSQFGVVCCCHVDEYETDIIKKHETTRDDKENDRTRHLLAIDAQTGPVFLTHRDHPDIDTLVAIDTAGRPLCHFQSADGVTHTIWNATDPQAYVHAFESLPEAYVADGHHRTASAARAAKTRREEYPDADHDAEFNWFLTVLFPASQLNVLAYHRLVTDLGDLEPQDVLEQLSALGTVESTDCPTPQQEGEFCLALADGWHRFTFKPCDASADPVAKLDVTRLQHEILGPMLGITDPRTDTRLQFLGGIHGTESFTTECEDLIN
ncbi:MAG: DUF1015 domain-containing protein [Phycisphaerales bacterium]|nr:DUF1015 domain-containing protein [Phycisphaerales bacterium]